MEKKQLYALIIIMIFMIATLLGSLYFLFFAEPEIIIKGHLKAASYPPIKENVSNMMVWTMVSIENGETYYLAYNDWKLIPATDQKYISLYGANLVVRGALRKAFDANETRYWVVKVIEISKQ